MSSYEQWWWDKLFAALYAAGYVIIKKPDISKGQPRRPGP